MKSTELTVVKKDNYCSPDINVTEISAEGVLCVSGIQNEGWQEETPDW